MNFSQLHERLRLEVQRRIRGGSLTAATLARRAGLQSPHLSNFLRSRRRLSLPSLDRVLAALEISVPDLIAPASATPPSDDLWHVPIITPDAALHRDIVGAAHVLHSLALPPHLAPPRSPAASGSHRDRFVATTVTEAQAFPMRPLLHPGAIVILDRHVRLPTGPRRRLEHIFAVPFRGDLLFRFVVRESRLLVLLALDREAEILTLPIPPESDGSAFVLGRVSHVLSRF